MSGGQLVVLDRNGRQGKRYSLPEGIASLGSDPDCDIRFMLSSVNKHHATVMVHANQAVVRNLCNGGGGVTLVNGAPVSVAALRHGDTICVGGRQLRWEYYDLNAPRPQAPQPALHTWTPRKSSAVRRNSSPRKQPTLRLVLDMTSRNSMPGTLGTRPSPTAGSKQVAIVQPQRRDTANTPTVTQHESSPRLIVQPHRPTPAGKRSRSKLDSSFDSSLNESTEKSRRKSAPRHSLTTSFENLQTKAALWIESRKSSPRKSLSTPVKMPSPQRHRTPNAQSPIKIAFTPKEQTPKKAIVEKTLTPKSPKTPRSPSKSTPKAKNIPSFVIKTPSSPKSAKKTTPKAKSTPKVNSSKSAQKSTPKVNSSKSAQKSTPKPKSTPNNLTPKSPKSAGKSIPVQTKRSSTVTVVTPKSPKPQKTTPKAKQTPKTSVISSSPKSAQKTTPKAVTPMSPKSQKTTPKANNTPKTVVTPRSPESAQKITPRSPKSQKTTPKAKTTSKTIVTPRSPKSAKKTTPKAQKDTPKMNNSPRGRPSKVNTPLNASKVSTPASASRKGRTPKPDTPRDRQPIVVQHMEVDQPIEISPKVGKTPRGRPSETRNIPKGRSSKSKTPRVSPKTPNQKSAKIQFTPKAQNKVPKPRTPTPRPARGLPSKADTPSSSQATSQPLKIVSRIPVRGALTPSVRTPHPAPQRSARNTPLRVQVLRKAYNVPPRTSVAKIEEPMLIDHTKQAALRLMAGHGQKSPKQAAPKPSPKLASVTPRRSPKQAATPNGSPKSVGKPKKVVPTPKSTPKQATLTPKQSPKQTLATPKCSPSLVVKKTPGSRGRKSRGSAGKRSSGGRGRRQTDSTPSFANSSASSRSDYTVTDDASTLLPSPRKSALRDPGSKSSRKNESIKFDLSNLESDYHSDVIMIDSTNDDTTSLALQYSETLISKSPSPRRSIHSRGSKILEKSLGSTISDSFVHKSTNTLTPPSPRARKSMHSAVDNTTLTPPPGRKSIRGSIMVHKALQKSDVSKSRKSAKSMFEDSINLFKSRKSSCSTKGESYSIVDLVSVDSNGSGRSSAFNSARSTYASTAFGTPQNSTGRKTRSLIEPSLLASSTPFGKRKSLSRSPSAPNLSTSTPVKNTSTSKSLSTPEDSKQTVNSTRISRTSKSRSRLNDSDSILLNSVLDLPDEFPKSSRKSKPSPTKLSVSNVSDKQSRSRRSLKLSPVSSPSAKKSRGSRSAETSRNLPAGLNDTTASLLSSVSNSPLSLKASSVGRVSSPKNKSTASRSSGIETVLSSPKSASKRISRSIASSQSSVLTSADDSVQYSPRKSRTSVLDSSLNSSRKSVGKSRASKSVGSSQNSTMLSANDESLSVSLSKKKSPGRKSVASSVSVNKRRTSGSFGSSQSISFGSPKANASTRASTTRTSLKRSSSSPQSGSRSPSPKKSRSSKSVGRNSSIASPNRMSGHRRSLKVSLTRMTPQQQKQGMVTPENEVTPDKAETPVLNIQSFLETSRRSAVSPRSQRGKKVFSGSKRQTTIGIIRSGPRKGRSSIKSKSLSLSARKTIFRPSKDSSAASDKTDEGGPRPDEDITPRSSIKVVPEAVKHRHSTAKKPQSKRSIIDNLNDSDIVKQLFNSPVKRKLSQSMTEYSKNESLKERKSKRLSKSSPAPNNTTLTRSSRSITVEEFVSPLSTPSNSPNLSGIKRLYKKNTPENDLRNVSAVKKILRTPNARKSVKNDLTNVSGVKLVFAKSPKNRLSDVRGVKEVFAPSPKNDLRRVTGVTSLFKTRKSPKNDLSNIAGVKNTFRKSVRNDLSNVSGVKQAFKKPPRNSLSNVSGVKHLFRRDKDSLSDLSGVEELFNVSHLSRVSDTEALFDELVGRPKIKSKYSAKSFINSKPQKRHQKKTKSLVPLDLIENNPEEWIEQELRKRVQKNISISTSKKSLNLSKSKSQSAVSSPNKSKSIHRTSGKSPSSSKTNITRELQKLTTDTVEGAAPLQNSRVRNVTHKSLSQSYERTLPLKKRSIVEASLEKTMEAKNRSRELPIKKRLVHSTPLRANATVNASVLGRESPIAAQADITVVSRGKQLKSPKGKQSQGRKTDISASGDAPTILITSKASPAKTPAKSRANLTASPAQNSVAGRRSKANVTNVTTNKSSIALPKKSLIISPKPSPKVARKGRKTKAEVTQPEIISPLKPRRGRATSKTEKTVSPKVSRAKKEKIVSPKVSRAKKRKSIVVVSKPSPKLNPQPAGGRNKNTKSTQSKKSASPQASRGRKTVVNTAPSPKAARSRKASSNVVEKVVSPPAARRGRKAATSVSTTPVTAGVKRGRTDVEANPGPKSPVASKRGRRAAEPESINAQPSKQRKAETKPKSPAAKSSAAKTKTKSPALKTVKKVVSPKKTQKASKAPSPAKAPIKSRRGRNAVVEEPKQTPKKVQKTVPAKKLTPKAKASPAQSPIKPRRGRNAPVITPKKAEPASKRGQKAQTVQAKKLTPKKKATPVQSPIKPVKKSAPKKIQTPVQSPVKPRGRGIHTDTKPVEVQTGRKRKADLVSPVKVVESKAKRGKQSPKKNVEEKKSVSPKKTRGGQKPSKVAPAESPKGRKRKASAPAKETKEPAAKRSRKSLSVSPVKPRPRAAKKPEKAAAATAAGRQRRR